MFLGDREVGKGAPVDQLDKACRSLKQCHKCAQGKFEFAKIPMSLNCRWSDKPKASHSHIPVFYYKSVVQNSTKRSRNHSRNYSRKLDSILRSA